MTVDPTAAPVRLRRDVFYADLGDAALIHNSETGFRLGSPRAYDFVARVLPLLDGTRTVADICAERGELAVAKVDALVAELLRRGYALPADPDADRAVELSDAERGRFAEQIEFARHYRSDGLAAFAALRGLRVGVIGTDAVARWAAVSLLRNGVRRLRVDADLLATGDAPNLTLEVAALAADDVPVELSEWPLRPQHWADLADVDVVVTGTDPAATRSLFTLARASVPAGRALVGAFRVGDQVVTGPLVTETRTSCPTCAALRLGANDEHGSVAGLWSTIANPGPGERTTPLRAPMAAMIGNLLGFDVFRRFVGVLEPETDGAVVVQNAHTADTRAATVLPHPRCEACYDPKPELPAVGTSLLSSALTADRSLPRPRLEDLDARAAERLELADVLVDDLVGMVTSFEDDTLLQRPLKITRVRFGLGHRERRCMFGADVHNVQRARLSALMAAARVYVEHEVPIRTEASGGSGRSIDGRRLLSWTDAGDDRSEPGPYVIGWSLLDGEAVRVPAGAVAPFGPDNDSGLWDRSSVGLGVGATLEAAVTDGVDSALAHAALRAAATGARARRLLTTDSDCAELDFVIDAARAAGHVLEFGVLEPWPDAPRQVVLARSGARWSVQAGRTRAEAGLAAAIEVLGRWQLADDDAEADLADPLLPGFVPSIDDSARALPMHEKGATRDMSWGALADVVAVPRVVPELSRAGLACLRVLFVDAPR